MLIKWSEPAIQNRTEIRLLSVNCPRFITVGLRAIENMSELPDADKRLYILFTEYKEAPGEGSLITDSPEIEGVLIFCLAERAEAYWSRAGPLH